MKHSVSWIYEVHISVACAWLCSWALRRSYCMCARTCVYSAKQAVHWTYTQNRPRNNCRINALQPNGTITLGKIPLFVCCFNSHTTIWPNRCHKAKTQKCRRQHRAHSKCEEGGGKELKENAETTSFFNRNGLTIDKRVCRERNAEARLPSFVASDAQYALLSFLRLEIRKKTKLDAFSPSHPPIPHPTKKNKLQKNISERK